MRLFLCGSLVIETDDGRLIAPPSPAQRRLLALLAVRSDRVVPTEVICDLLELSPGSLRTTVSRVRKIVGDVLATEPPGYVLRSIDTDVAEFELLAQRATDANGEEALELRSNALQLVRGEPLAEFADETWARPEALRYRELKLAVAEAHALALIESGRPDAAIAGLQPHIHANPYSDSLRGLHMRALASAGRQVDAMREYQSYWTLLADEVGAMPGAALQELDRQIASDQLVVPEVAPPLHDRLRGQTESRGGSISPSTPDGDLAVLIANPCVRASSSGGSDLGPGVVDPAAVDLTSADRIVLTAIEAHGGKTFNSDTDALAAVFESADQAVAAAIQAQADCRIRSDRLDLRAGIDIGLMERKGDRFIGPSVARSMRLWEAANDQQILATSAAVTLLRPNEAVSLVDLGAHRLPQIRRPVEIYGVHATAEEWAAGSPETVHSGLGNIKRAATSYVEHGDQVRRLAAAVDSARLVTVRGPGGVGKTRLVTETALRLSPSPTDQPGSGADAHAKFAHGIWFVPLLDAVDSASVAAVAATTLGIESPDGTDPADLLVSALGVRSMLLILDNCEHVLDGVRALTRRILNECPAVHVLTTSRESVGLSGEQIYAVETLPVESSVLLLTDRASLLGISLGEREDAKLVRELCAKLEGIPLAIELAAARLDTLDASAILARLDRRLRLLVGGDPETRHQTSLRETMQWSFDLLTPSQQEAFLALAVFSAGFDLSAACAVLSGVKEELDEFDVLDLLGEFIDKSLVIRETAAGSLGRYRMLETLREFCAEQLSDEDKRETRLLHAAHFESRVNEIAEMADGTDWDGGLAILDAEWNNIRAAVIGSIESEDLATAEHVLDRLFFVTWLGGLQEPPVWAERLLIARSRPPLQALGGAEWVRDDAAIEDVSTLKPGVLGLVALAMMRSRRVRAASELIDALVPMFQAADTVTRVAIGSMRTQIYGTVDSPARGHEFSMDFFADMTHDPACDLRVQSSIACSGALTSMMPIDESRARMRLARRLLAAEPNPANETLVTFHEALISLAEGDFAAMEALSAKAFELAMGHRVEYLKQLTMLILTQTPGRAGLDWSLRAAREAHQAHDHSLFLGAVEAGALHLLGRGQVDAATQLLGHLGRTGGGMQLVSDERSRANAQIATLDGGQGLLDRGAALDSDDVIALFESTVELVLSDTTEAEPE